MTTSLLTKSRIQLPIIKICFEIYHALRPYHHLNDKHYPSIKRSVVFLFFIALRWYFFIKHLILNKMALNKTLSVRERISYIVSICGHLIMCWAQESTLKHEKNNKYKDMINNNGPYGIIRHPHHSGKWISEFMVAIYQNNKIAMLISLITLKFTINRINKEEKYQKSKSYQHYKRKVPFKLFPRIY